MAVQLPPPKPDQVELVRELTRILNEYEQKIAELEAAIAALQAEQ